MSKPIAVLISDIHFNIHTLELAAQALLQAQFKAKMLKVPLVIAGDLLDTKAIIRAEVANRLIEMLSVKDAPETIILVGNHDLINEKGKEHALNFLKPYATVVEHIQTGQLCGTTVTLIPYQSNPQNIIDFLKDEDDRAKEIFEAEGYTLARPMIIMHQGVQGSLMGDYVVDKTAVPKDTFTGHRVISGHYHPRQLIACLDDGSVSYIGNPYTLGFGEANDPEKGYQILYSTGGLEFVPTKLRKHIIYDLTIKELSNTLIAHRVDDLVWLKITGTKEELAKLEHRQTGGMFGTSKVDLIPLDQETQAPSKADSMSQGELLDSLIDSMTNTEDTTKARLKELWRTCASN